MIMQKTTDLINRGSAIIDKRLHFRWKQHILNRIDDKYKGQDLEIAVCTMEAINEGASMVEAQKIIKSYYASPDLTEMAFYSIILFSNKGAQLYRHCNKNIPPIMDKFLKEQEAEHKANNNSIEK